MSSPFLVCCLIITGAHLILADTKEKQYGLAQSPTIRKLGKHEPVPGPSPHEGVKREESVVAEQEAELENHHGHHHHRADKSIAGGGVIIGGLVTTFLVTVFCYLRATRRRTVVAPAGSPTGTPPREKESVECGHVRINT
ncbi:F3L24.15 protein [Striga asiatica]|uniref:F3L24.15 protein n=1 Tax=Striga asiatica TaxID=4170 RepID=A0A5A7R9J4_STRAF|nr:F3L24.15 protein [Striga asiatica]